MQELKQSIIRLEIPKTDVISHERLEIFKKYAEKKCEEKARIIGFGGKENLDTKVRDVKNYSLFFDVENSVTDKVFIDYIKNIISTYFITFQMMHPHCKLRKINQVDFLKYEPGGKYEIHVDHFATSPRTMTVIINLNEDYEGGDFVFYNTTGKQIIKKEKLKTGSMVYFPSNFLFPHAVEPITKGVRYSIVIWTV